MKVPFSSRFALQVVRNMGMRFVVFRFWYEFQIRIGMMKLRFPKNAAEIDFVSLTQWRNLPVKFFPKPGKNQKDQDLTSLQNRATNIWNNHYRYFSSLNFTVRDWHTNPKTGFVYEKNQHWSCIKDFSDEAGDIKYVWEKSRFTFLYDLIRYDFHFSHDQSEIVFLRIEHWILENPVNCGPNWKCSQEITIRVLNWIFALHYYKDSPHLSSQLFSKVVSSIYRQMQHVRENINFSRIAVRNNHALTETLGLYLTGLLFPFFPESDQWKREGRIWFEQEIAYQIYEDGTFLQFSTNYHRVVIQLLTWAIALAELNDDRWGPIIYERARKSIIFLRTCQDDQSGWLPNYGNNDGALFFPLTDCHFRDYRPQMGALANLLGLDIGYESGPWQEESSWLHGTATLPRDAVSSRDNNLNFEQKTSSATFCFRNGGFFILRDKNTVTFLRCGTYKDRPYQADNLHLDIWVNGENVLRDAGSYQYNTSKELSKYFMGSASHNTIMLNDYDQMDKGPGFMWFNWIEKSEGRWSQNEKYNEVIFDGYFEGFRQVRKGIIHRRRVTKKNGVLHWKIEDWLENAPDRVIMKQLWHPSKNFFEEYLIHAVDNADKEIDPELSNGWHSGSYGTRETADQIVFATKKRYIKTVLKNRHVL